MMTYPSCPKEVLAKAQAAWEWAEKHEVEDEANAAELRLTRDRLRQFVRTVENAYKRVPWVHRDRLEFGIEFNGSLNDWRKSLHDAVAHIAFIAERPRGPKRRALWEPEISLTGLRAFAMVIGDHWTEELGRKWRYGASDQPASPAERFFLSSAKCVDDRVTCTMIRTVMKHPE